MQLRWIDVAQKYKFTHFRCSCGSNYRSILWGIWKGSPDVQKIQTPSSLLVSQEIRVCNATDFHFYERLRDTCHLLGTLLRTTIFWNMLLEFMWTPIQYQYFKYSCHSWHSNITTEHIQHEFLQFYGETPYQCIIIRIALNWSWFSTAFLADNGKFIKT